MYFPAPTARPFARSLAALAAVAFVASATPAAAGQPATAHYGRATDRAFWFVYTADVHIGRSIGTNRDEERLIAFLGEIRDTIAPAFMLVGGDLVESGVAGQLQWQWEDYARVCAAAPVDPAWYFDVPGNHDVYGDGEKVHFLAYSVQGQAQGTTHYAFRHELPFGSFHIIGMDSSSDAGLPWPADDAGFDEDALEWFEDELYFNQDVDLTFVFSHHPLSHLWNGRAEFTRLLGRFAVSAYLAGHVHSWNVAREEGILTVTAGGLGPSAADQIALVAIDHNAVAVQSVTVGQWPVVIITAPVDQRLGGTTNPVAYPVPAGQVDNPLRALVFSQDRVREVQFKLGESRWTEMRRVAPPLYEARLDTTGLAVGDYPLSVRAIGWNGTASHDITIRVAEVPPVGPVVPVPTDVVGGDVSAADVAEPDVAEPDTAVPDAGAPEPDAPPADDAAASDGDLTPPPDTATDGLAPKPDAPPLTVPETGADGTDVDAGSTDLAPRIRIGGSGGCATTPAPASSAWGLLLLLAALVYARRRPARR